MNTSHVKQQPQDPVAARLGIYAARIAAAAVVLIAAASYLR